jgi:hypothetical protein
MEIRDGRSLRAVILHGLARIIRLLTGGRLQPKAAAASFRVEKDKLPACDCSD